MKTANEAGTGKQAFLRQTGISLLETAIALAILSVIAITFLSGVSTSAGSVYTADERATAESLARSQMEWAKYCDYSYNATSYVLAPLLDASDYEQYSANITAASLHDPDEGIQKITVTISRNNEIIYTLESYKVDR